MIIQDILHPLHSFLYIWTGCASLSGAKKTKQGACFLRSSPRFFGVPKQRPRHVVRFGLSSYLGCGFSLRVEKPSRCVWWKWSLKSKCTYTEFTSGWDPKNKKSGTPVFYLMPLFGILCYRPTVSKPFMSSQNTQEQRKHLTRIEMPKVKVSPTAAKSPSISRNWISNGLDRLVGYGLSARVMEDAGRVGPGYPGIEIIEIGIQKVTKVGPPHRTSCLTSW